MQLLPESYHGLYGGPCGCLVNAVSSSTARYRLDLYHEGVHIGEYERSWVSGESGDHAAKVGKADGASELLIEASKRTANGKIAVRWNGETKEKHIRTYGEGCNNPGQGEPVVALIPRSYWRKP